MPSEYSSLRYASDIGRLLHAVFSGAVHSELDHILRGFKRDFSLDKLWNLTKRDLSRLSSEDFEIVTIKQESGVMI